MAESINNCAFHELGPPMRRRRGRVLVVESDPLVCASIIRTLLGAGHEVVAATDWKTALARLSCEAFDLLLAELRGTRARGPDLLAEARRLRPDLTVALLTAYGTTGGALEALRKGVYDFIQKPFDKDELLLLVDRVLELGGLKAQVRLLRQALAPSDASPALVGQSAILQRVRGEISAATQRRRSVVVRGERGTGRSLAAALIHIAGGPAGPFLAIHCPSVAPAQLATLVPGWTMQGAVLDAFLDSACTLVLDEVEQMPAELLSSLVRFLQARSMDDSSSGSARVVAITGPATADANDGVGRAWERAGAAFIDLPPLRDRCEDVPELVRHFLHRRSRRTGLPFRHVEPEAMRLLQKYPWPGNVRELKDLVERADVAETQPGVVRAATIAPWLNAAPPAVVNGHRHPATLAADPLDRLPLAEVEKRVILDTLAKFEGHRARTATALGIGIRTLGIKLKKWREDGELAELPYL